MHSIRKHATVLCIVLAACGILTAFMMVTWQSDPKSNGASSLGRLDRTLMDPVSQSTLPPEIVGILGGNFGRHSAPAKCVAISPNQKYVASGSRDKTVKLWDLETLSEIRSFPHPDDVDQVWFSNDSNLLHSACWDGNIRTFQTEAKSTNSFASTQISDVGFRVAHGTDDKRLFIPTADRSDRKGHKLVVTEYQWRQSKWVKSNELYNDFMNFLNDPQHIAVSGDGLRIALPSPSYEGDSKGEILLWDLSNGQAALSKFKFQGNQITAVAFEPKGQFLLVGDDQGKLAVISTTDTAKHSLLPAHQEALRCISFSPDGSSFFTGSDDKTILAWDWNHGEPKARAKLEGHSDWVYEIAVNSEGNRMFSAGWDHMVRCWHLVDNEMKLQEVAGHQHDVCSIAFSADGKWIATGSTTEIGYPVWPPNDVLLWELGGGQPRLSKKLRGCRGYVHGLSFSRDGALLVAGDDEGLKIWNLDDVSQGKLEPQEFRPVDAHLSCYSVAFLGSTHRLVAGWNKGQVWLMDLDVQPPKKLSAWTAPFNYVEQMDVTSSGENVFVSSISLQVSDDRLQETDSAEKKADPNPKRVGQLEVYSPTLPLYYRVAIAEDGSTLVCATKKGELFSYNRSSSQPTKSENLHAHTHGIEALDIAADGTVVSGDWDGFVRQWKLPLSNKPIREWKLGRVWSLQFAPDGKHFAVGSGSGLVYLLRL